MITKDEIYRRAGGRRRYQSLLRLRALLRRGEILELLKQTGFRHGAQAEIARVLGVSQSTISRDFRDIKARFKPCPTCGAVIGIRQSAARADLSVLLPLGRLLITPGAAEALEDAGQSPREFVGRHARLERGELSDEDHKENLFSVGKALRIFSAFLTARGVKVWVITEADRSATTILLPGEY